MPPRSYCKNLYVDVPSESEQETAEDEKEREAKRLKRAERRLKRKQKADEQIPSRQKLREDKSTEHKPKENKQSKWKKTVKDEEDSEESPQADIQLDMIEEEIEDYIDEMERKIQKEQKEFDKNQYQIVTGIKEKIQNIDDQIKVMMNEKKNKRKKNKERYIEEFLQMLDELKELTCCPIGCEEFSDPVVSSFGHVYENCNINKCYQTRLKDPIARRNFEVNQTRPHYLAKGAISVLERYSEIANIKISK